MSGGRPKSSIWEHFTITSDETGDKIILCRYCPATWSGKTSAYRLVDHIADVCKASNLPEDARSFAKAQQQSRVGSAPWKPGQGKGRRAPTADIPGWGVEAITTLAKKQSLRNAAANFFFANNIALCVANDYYYRAYVNELRSTFKPPCGQTLRVTLLNAKAAEAERFRVEAVQTAEVVSLSVDGWTNVRKEEIIHVVVYAPRPLLWKSITVDVDTCDAEYIATKVLDCVREIESVAPKTTVCSLITDNAANMKKAWRLVMTVRPKMFTFGCAAHGLHLFMKDVIANVPTVRDAVEGATTVARVLRESTKLFRRLHRAQEFYYGKEMSILLPGKTRWLSVYNPVASVLRSKTAIQALADLVSDKEFKRIVKSETFWESCLKVAPLLRSCCLAILSLESDSACIVKSFHAMVGAGTAIETGSFPDVEKSRMLEQFRHRFAFLYAPELVTASVLHPMAKPTRTAIEIAKNFLRTRYGGADSAQLEADLNAYLSRTAPFALPEIWAPEVAADAYAWWKARNGAERLRVLGLAFYTTPATSAAAERTFKVAALMQSKLRNGLANEATAMLAGVKMFLRAKVPQRMARDSTGGSRKTLISNDEPEIRSNATPDPVMAAWQVMTPRKEKSEESSAMELAPDNECEGNEAMEAAAPDNDNSDGENIDDSALMPLEEDDGEDLDHISLDGTEFFDEDGPDIHLSRDIPNFSLFQTEEVGAVPDPEPLAAPSAGSNWGQLMFK